jgi:hypothetical protein
MMGDGWWVDKKNTFSFHNMSLPKDIITTNNYWVLV